MTIDVIQILGTNQLDGDGKGDVCDDPNNDGCGGCGQPQHDTLCYVSFYSKVLNKVGSAIALHLIFPYVVMPL